MKLSELLFYGGIFIAAVSLLIAVVSFAVLKGKSGRLRVQLDEEYGSPEKR